MRRSTSSRSFRNLATPSEERSLSVTCFSAHVSHSENLHKRSARREWYIMCAYVGAARDAGWGAGARTRRAPDALLFSSSHLRDREPASRGPVGLQVVIINWFINEEQINADWHSLIEMTLTVASVIPVFLKSYVEILSALEVQYLLLWNSADA